EWAKKVALFGQAIAFVERSILLNDKRDLSWALLARYSRELNLTENESAAGARPFQDEREKLSPLVLEERLITLANANQDTEAESLMTGELDPNNNGWAKSVLGFVRLTSGRYEDVINLVKDLPPDEPWVIETRALARDMLGDLPGGDSDWQELLQNSSLPEMAREFAYATCKLGRLEESVGTLESLVANPIKRVDAERMLVLCRLAQQRYDVAMEMFQRAARKSSVAELRRWTDLDLLSPRIRKVIPEKVLQDFLEASERQMKQAPPALELELQDALQI